MRRLFDYCCLLRGTCVLRSRCRRRVACVVARRATARGDDWHVEFLAVTIKWFTLIKLREINEEVSNVLTQKTMLIYLIEKASEMFFHEVQVSKML